MAEAVLQLEADATLEDIDDAPTRMERLYRRRDNDARSMTALEAVRCPVCGRAREWRTGRQRPFCQHDPDQARWLTNEPEGGW